MINMRLDKEKNRLFCTPGNEDDFTTLLRLPSRRWMARQKLFIVPATRVNCAALLATTRPPDDDPALWEYLQTRASDKKGERPFPRWYGFKTNPFPDQHNATHKCYKNNSFALFMRMGSGKSKVYVDMATAAFYERLINVVVLICPLAVKPVWMASDGQIAAHSPCPVVKVNVDGNFDPSAVPVSQERLTWLFVGVESLSQGKTFEKLLPFIENNACAVLVDESSRIKNPSAIRTKRVVQLGRPAKMRGIATGTSVTKSLGDLYSQFEFLDPDIIGVGDAYSFRNRYCVMGGYKNKKIIGYDNVDELMRLIEPYTYICDKPAGLPQKLFTQRRVELSDEQKDMYHKLKKAKITEVSVANVLNRVAKAQEIVGGFLREDPKRTVDPFTGREKKTQGKIIWTLPIDKNPKIAELHNLVEEAGDEQAVIWCKFRWELEQVAIAVGSHGKVAQMHGDVPTDERTLAVQQFQGGDYKFMVATQQVGGIGHTMTSAHLMHYYSNTHSLEDRLQSEDRIHRIGQDDNCLYTDLIANRTVDELIQDSIKSKKSLDQYVRDKLVEASTTLADMLGEP